MRRTGTRFTLISVSLAVVLVAFAVGCSAKDAKDSSGSPSTGSTSGGELPPADTFAGGDRSGEGVSPGPAGDGQVVPGADTGSAPNLAALLDRKIVQSTSVDLGVNEVARSFQDIIRITETAGGFVASSAFSNQDDQQIADLTVRVPADQYQSVLADIRGMGTVDQEGSDANDVTEEYTDLAARLRTLEATEQRYLELLGQATTINDILVVQDRLDGVRAQIEQVQGRTNLLDHLTDLATITVHIRPLAAAVDASGGGGTHPLRAAANAWEHSLEALRGVTAAALVVAVFSWWLVPPAMAIGFGTRWWLGRRPQTATGPAA